MRLRQATALGRLRAASVVLAYLLSAIGGLASPSPAMARAHRSALPPLAVGLSPYSEGWGPATMGRLRDMVRAAGARWIREPLRWAVAEPEPGQWRWDRYDRLFTSSARHGLTVLPVLLETPPWAGRAWNTLPAEPLSYAGLVAQVTARYGPGGTFWRSHPALDGSLAPRLFELWNEPYLSRFSDGGVDPARYARLVRAAAQAGRRANPASGFLIEADYYPGLADYFEGMYRAVPDLNAYFDGIAVHPYSLVHSPADRSDRWGVRRLEDVHRHFAAHGAGTKPLWITEIGWSTCPDNDRFCVSERRQAADIRSLFALLRHRWRSYVRGVFLYKLTSDPGSASDHENWFGLMRANGTRKPAWYAFRRAARRR